MIIYTLKYKHLSIYLFSKVGSFAPSLKFYKFWSEVQSGAFIGMAISNFGVSLNFDPGMFEKYEFFLENCLFHTSVGFLPELIS